MTGVGLDAWLCAKILDDLEAEGLILRDTNKRQKYLAPSDIYQPSTEFGLVQANGSLVQENRPETLGFEDDLAGQLVQPAHYIDNLDSILNLRIATSVPKNTGTRVRS